jgi:hypothetical protein
VTAADEPAAARESGHAASGLPWRRWACLCGGRGSPLLALPGETSEASEARARRAWRLHVRSREAWARRKILRPVAGGGVDEHY